jgi:hypothetical protein
LHGRGRVCYSSRPASAAHEIEEIARTAENEGVDELSELMHNLSSLLLTNKTIRKRSKAVPNTEFFNNKQSISVGV